MWLWSDVHTAAWFSPQSTPVRGGVGTDLGGLVVCAGSPSWVREVDKKACTKWFGETAFMSPLLFSQGHDIFHRDSTQPQWRLGFSWGKHHTFYLEGISKERSQALGNPSFLGSADKFPEELAQWGRFPGTRGEWVNVCKFWKRSYITDKRGKRGEC